MVERENQNKEEIVEQVIDKGKKQIQLSTVLKTTDISRTWVQITQQTKDAENRKYAEQKPKGIQVSRNIPTENRWVKIEPKKIAQNLSRNLRRVVI